jgi:Ca2+/Na+ antiporter
MGLGVLIVIGSLVLLVSRQKGVKKISYKTFFILGIPLLGLGFTWIVMDFLRPIGIVFLCMGAIYLVISLAYKDKWKPSKSNNTIEEE